MPMTTAVTTTSTNQTTAGWRAQNDRRGSGRGRLRFPVDGGNALNGGGAPSRTAAPACGGGVGGDAARADGTASGLEMEELTGAVVASTTPLETEEAGGPAGVSAFRAGREGAGESATVSSSSLGVGGAGRRRVASRPPPECEGADRGAGRSRSSL
jgi:hypothetical protein